MKSSATVPFALRRDDEERVHALDLAEILVRDQVIWDEIFWSALIRYSGAPVISAEPRSAAYSR